MTDPAKKIQAIGTIEAEILQILTTASVYLDREKVHSQICDKTSKSVMGVGNILSQLFHSNCLMRYQAMSGEKPRLTSFYAIAPHGKVVLANFKQIV